MRRATSITLNDQERLTLQRPAVVAARRLGWCCGPGSSWRGRGTGEQRHRRGTGHARRPSPAGATGSPTGRLAGIEKDAPRGGRPPTIRGELAPRIVEATTQSTPDAPPTGARARWPKHLGVSRSMVNRVWRANG